MESRRDKKVDDSEFWYLPGTALLNPTYNNRFSSGVSSIIKWFASKPMVGEPTLFSSGTQVKFLQEDDSSTPAVLKKFKKYADMVAPDPKNHKYVQWSGDLGSTAWKKTVAVLRQYVLDKLETRTSKEPLKIHIMAHSHGGQIARLLAEEFKDFPVEFYIGQVGTPLCIYPPTKMPENVKMWLNVVVGSGDFKRKIGSVLMQSEMLLGNNTALSPAGLSALVAAIRQFTDCDYVDTIKELLIEEHMQKSGANTKEWVPFEDYARPSDIERPSGWLDYFLRQPISNPHEGPVKDEKCIEEICTAMLDVLEEIGYFDRLRAVPAPLLR